MTSIKWAGVVIACLAYAVGVVFVRRMARTASGTAAERVSSFGTVLAIAWPIVFAIVVFLGVMGFVVMRWDRRTHRRSMTSFDDRLDGIRASRAETWARDVERAREEEQARNRHPWHRDADFATRLHVAGCMCPECGDQGHGDGCVCARCMAKAGGEEMRPLSEQLTKVSEYDRHEHVVGGA